MAPSVRPGAVLPALLLALALAATGARAACTTEPPATLNVRWTCGASTPSGGSCAGACNTGFNATPAVATCSGTTWTVTPGCFKQCLGTLPVLQGGTWNPACATAAYNAWCNGTCGAGTYGAPAVQCNGAWSSTIIGRCSTSAVNCPGYPPTADNQQPWSTTVRGTSAGGIATATCQTGYLGAGSPQSVCQANGTWSTPSPPNCLRGLANGTAFITNYNEHKIVICSVANGRFASCRSDDGTAGGAPAFLFPTASATLGSRVMVLEQAQQPQMHICSWSASTRALSNCVVSSLGGYAPADGVWGLVVDPRSALVYVSDYVYARVLVCDGALTTCTPFSFPSGSEPTGLALSPDGTSIYVSLTLRAAFVKCPLTPGGINVAGCVTTNLADIVGFAYPVGITVDTTRIVVADQYSNTLLVCPVTNPGQSTCVVSHGDGTLSGPGYAAVALSGGYLWVPNYGGSAISVCLPSATGCSLRIAPDDGGQNILLSGSTSIFIAGP